MNRQISRVVRNLWQRHRWDAWRCWFDRGKVCNGPDRTKHSSNRHRRGECPPDAGTRRGSSPADRESFAACTWPFSRLTSVFGQRSQGYFRLLYELKDSISEKRFFNRWPFEGKILECEQWASACGSQLASFAASCLVSHRWTLLPPGRLLSSENFEPFKVKSVRTTKKLLFSLFPVIFLKL